MSNTKYCVAPHCSSPTVLNSGCPLKADRDRHKSVRLSDSQSSLASARRQGFDICCLPKSHRNRRRCVRQSDSSKAFHVFLWSAGNASLFIANNDCTIKVLPLHSPTGQGAPSPLGSSRRTVLLNHLKCLSLKRGLFVVQRNDYVSSVIVQGKRF